MLNEGMRMPNVNVYVSDELRARMDSTENVNWSRVAQSAFERECTRMERNSAAMSGVIERLRASKDDFLDQERATGKSAGRSWAERHASYGDLVALTEHWNRLDEWDHMPEIETDLASCLYREQLKYRDAEEYLRDRGIVDADRHDMPSAEWFKGFFKGAVEFYEEVKDQI